MFLKSKTEHLYDLRNISYFAGVWKIRGKLFWPDARRSRSYIQTQS